MHQQFIYSITVHALMCVMLVKDWHRRRSADSTAKRFKSVVFCLSNITSMKFRYGPREEEQKKNEMWAGLDTKETDGQILRTYNTAKLSKKHTHSHSDTRFLHKCSVVTCTVSTICPGFIQGTRKGLYLCMCVCASVCWGFVPEGSDFWPGWF